MAKSKAELQAAWWRRWWEADHSWAGLAPKPIGANRDVIHGGRHGETNLQAYWRIDPETAAIRDDPALRAAGELVTGPDGRAWHIAHLPWVWEDGTPAKAAWDGAALERLAAVIRRRIAAASETRTSSLCDAEEPDGRAQLTGVIHGAPLGPPDGLGGRLHAVCTLSLLPGLAGRGLALGPGFRCDLAHFPVGAGFDGAVFTGASTFDRASFAQDCSFEGATFHAEAGFRDTSFGGRATFSGASFSHFAAPACFDGASFGGQAGFAGAVFTGNASFREATFLRDGLFHGANFLGGLDFSSAEIRGAAQFGQVRFAQVRFGQVRFSQPGGGGQTWFRGCSFKGFAVFDKATFGTRVEFSASSFGRLASFKAITWPDRPADWHGMFDQATFKDLASFKGSGLQRFAAFDGAVFQGGLQLDDVDEDAALATFRRERKLARGLPDRGAGLRGLEGGCRVIKQAMEKAANKTREQVFYAFELKARRHQRTTPWWERKLSWLYDRMGGYGRSIGRPIVGLALLVPIFAAAYAALTYGWRADAVTSLSPRIVALECLSYSAQRVLPFGPWNLTPAQIAQSTMQSMLQGQTNSLFSFAIRMLGTVQSVLALALAFLAGLAIRRRFQIG